MDVSETITLTATTDISNVFQNACEVEMAVTWSVDLDWAWRLQGMITTINMLHPFTI